MNKFRQNYSSNVGSMLHKWIADEKPLLALDALTKLNEQFANKPEFHMLTRTLLLTLSGQFSITSAFAMLRQPDYANKKVIYLAIGKFAKNRQLESLYITSELERYYIKHKAASLVSKLDPPESCINYKGILHDNGVVMVCPLVHNDKLIGFIGLGNKVAGKTFEEKEIELFNTLMHSVVPLIASSYHFWEVANLSSWYLDILNHIRQGVFAFSSDNRLKKINTPGFNLIRRHNPGIPDIISTYNMSIEEVFTDEIFNDWAKRFVKGITENQHGSIENLSVKTENGEYVYDIYFCQIHSDSEYEADFIITVYDVTERIQAEKQKRLLQEKLEQAEKMEALGVLAGGVAHDLNNMLGPLVGYPELILRKLPDDSPIRNQVKKIGDSARNASNVIQDLLALARRGRYEMEPINLNKVIVDYLESPIHVQKCQNNPNIEINYDLDENINNILGSGPHLYKVIMNLIVNAFESMPDGGDLSITTTQAHLNKLYGGYDKIEKGEYNILRIRDSGMGIEHEDIDRIFEPYFSRKKMGSSGSGLGLSVVYGIIKDHRAHYDIFSEIGQGTEFIFYFPITKQMERTSNNVEKIRGGTERVLVVDDIAEQREIAVELLGSLGYKVHTAENGRKALEYLSKHSVDMVVLDMIMEKDFDGLDTYREILNLHPGQKAVIVSGFSATERVRETQDLGAGEYIKKPFTLDTIGHTIRKELDKKIPD